MMDDGDSAGYPERLVAVDVLASVSEAHAMGTVPVGVWRGKAGRENVVSDFRS